MSERKGVEEVRAEQRKLAESYRRCFRSPAGTVVLDQLKEVGKESPFVKGDPHATSYNVGKQDVIREILSTIETAENNIEVMGEE